MYTGYTIERCDVWWVTVGTSETQHHHRNLVYFLVENQCDYHQGQILNFTSPAEQTLAGRDEKVHDQKRTEKIVFLLGMVRTMLSFSVIHIFLVIITFICGLYSIREYRYTYKRLTAMIYILTGNRTSWTKIDYLLLLAVTLLVCIEVLSLIFRHASDHLPHIYPHGAKHSYGICYFLAWLVFIQLLASAFIFALCSKKRKGTFDEATEEEALANQPVDLGRL